MADDADPPRPADVPRREADTAALVALGGFATSFFPAVGEGRQPGTAADALNPGLAACRNLALHAAFAAIETLANRLATPWPPTSPRTEP